MTHLSRVALCVALTGCTCGQERPEVFAAIPSPVPEARGEPPSIEALATGAVRAASGDFDGDGRPDLALGTADGLRVVALDGRELGRASAQAGIQTLLATDVDGDGRADIVAGWGRSREHLGATLRIRAYRIERGGLVEEEIASPATERADVAAIVAVPGSPELLIAHFESQYMVRTTRARRDAGRWTLRQVATLRMATSHALADVDGDGRPDHVVGRIYGDDIEQPGDAFVLREDGARIPIAITGGVRSMTAGDVDGDGRAEVLLGDGWNRNYGQLARARLTLARWNGAGFDAALLGESQGEFGLFALHVVDFGGDGSREIVSVGSAKVRVLRREGGGWSATDVATGCSDALAADLDGERGDELLLLCDGGARLYRGP